MRVFVTSEGYCIYDVNASPNLRGQFEAWFISNPAAGPPLSVVNMMIEFCNIPLAWRAFVMFPIESSRADTIPRMHTNYTAEDTQIHKMHLMWKKLLENNYPLKPGYKRQGSFYFLFS